MADKKTAATQHNLPEGRAINLSLFERDAYMDPSGKGQPGEPMYKIEVAYNPSAVKGEGTIEDVLADAIAAEWGEAAAEDFLAGGTMVASPLLDGDVLAAARVKKGKEGDAYKGKIVIRMGSKFNKDGVDGPGGIAVFDQNVKPLTIMQADQVYPGMMVEVAATTSISEFGGVKRVKLYLTAVQKTGDGERLTTAADRSTLFQPKGAVAGAPAAGRRRRAG